MLSLWPACLIWIRFDRPHLLAPTSSDLVKYGQKDTISIFWPFMVVHVTQVWTSGPGIPANALESKSLLGITCWCKLENNLNISLVDWLKLAFMKLLSTRKLLQSVVPTLLCTIERRKVQFPDRSTPLIRISSTSFWHLSSDYDLVPIASLKDKARILRAKNLRRVWMREMKWFMNRWKLDNNLKFARKPHASFCGFWYQYKTEVNLNISRWWFKSYRLFWRLS